MEKYKIISIERKNCNVIGICSDSYNREYFYKKALDTNITHKKMLVNELRILQLLSSLESVPKIYDYSFNDNDNYIILELLNGVTLENYIFRNNEYLFIFYKLLETIEKIHDYGVIHCDLKLSNVMILNNSIIKIFDFGTSTIRKTQLFHGYVSILQCAPEQMVKGVNEVSNQTDIYSLGVILYWLTMKKFPFNGRNAEEIKNNKLANNFELSDNVFLNKIFLKSMNYDVKKRYKSISDFKKDILVLLEKEKTGLK